MIFGVEPPRFIYNHGLDGEVTVDLDYVAKTEFEPETEYLEHVDELTLDRALIAKRAVWTVRFILNLFKYADPQAKYAAIILHKGRDVSVYLHRDGHPFAQSYDEAEDTTVDALFRLKEVTPFFLETALYRDGLILEFETVGHLDTVILPPANEWIPYYDADGLPVYDADGKQYMVRR